VLAYDRSFGNEYEFLHKHKHKFVFVRHKHKKSFGIAPLTPTTKTVVGVPTSVTQKVTWKDALFPRVVPTRASALHSRELQARNSINISNSNVNSAL
jgi:hypothetical protein